MFYYEMYLKDAIVDLFTHKYSIDNVVHSTNVLFGTDTCYVFAP